MREQVRLGQRIEKFIVEAWKDQKWEKILDGQTIGYQSILTLKEPITTDKIRLSIEESLASPCISELSLLKLPKSMPKPLVTRNSDNVVIDAKESKVYYTLDGSSPNAKSTLYTAPITMPQGGVVKARIIDDQGNIGPEETLRAGISKKNWKVAAVSAGDTESAKNAFDDKLDTIWSTEGVADKLPQSFTIELDKPVVISEFSYIPRQDHNPSGMTNKFIFEVSPDGKKWAKVGEGEFSNLRANPIEQFVPLTPTKQPMKFFRFTATNSLENTFGTVAELSIYSKK